MRRRDCTDHARRIGDIKIAKCRETDIKVASALTYEARVKCRHGLLLTVSEQIGLNRRLMFPAGAR